jgi:L-histidine N-alpha-methyltransferase
MSSGLTGVSARFELVHLESPGANANFAADVAAGLAAAPKRIPSKYLYDDAGSALFDAITHLPEYYLAAAEAEILHEWGWEMVRSLGGALSFLELGSGSAKKTQILIEEALRVQGFLRYSPIDISTDALTTSSRALIAAYPGLSIRAYAGDYFSALASRKLRLDGPVLAMLMGSNVGNYERSEACELLSLVARVLHRGDGLLLGVDEKKDRATLELAYDDPAGVTAAFNKNLLMRVNRELGGAFDPRRFRFFAAYDADRGAVDSYLEALHAHDVRIDALDLSVHFGAGERIHTESSYKFDDGDVDELARASGLRADRAWHDRANRFKVHLLVKP